MESHVGCYYEIRECIVGQSEGKNSSLLIRLESNNKNDLLNVIPKKIELLAHLTVGSEAIIKTYYGREGENQQRKKDNINILVAKGSAIESLGAHSTYTNENILILGAGRVSASVAEYIGCTSHRQVILLSVFFLLIYARSSSNGIDNSFLVVI